LHQLFREAEVTFTIPKSELDRLKRNCIQNSVEAKRELGQEVNQRSLNIAGRIFDYIPPSSGEGVEAKRFEVRAYLGTPLSSRIRIPKRGKRKGRFIRSGGRARQLIRANLILQARRAKHGAKGLYGKAMQEASGAFRRRAQISVGFLKSPMLPIIRTLNGLCRFKFPFAKTKNIARWPKSAGNGWARVTGGDNPMVIIEAKINSRTNSGKIQSIYNAAATKAVKDENAEIESHREERKKKLLAKLRF
jgi:hypothetical protein